MTTVGSLFSGIGGLDLGLERAGLQIIWQSEINLYACVVLRRRWPEVPNLGDITKIDWSKVERPDILVGGFPCQDLSHAHTAGARQGLAGPASSLWREFAQAIASLEPAWVVVENVETWRSWVPEVRATLASHRYASLPVQLSAGTFGAPHRRPRVFVVANANGDGQSLLSLHEEVGKLRPIPRGGGDWRCPPPGGFRVADGLAHRMDRLDAIGNAVVPAVGEWLGRWLSTNGSPATSAAKPN